MTNQRGFTLIEVIIAIIVLTIGVMGLATTAALVTRMIARGQRSAMAATFAAQRMELERPAACIAAQRIGGSDTLYRGSSWVASNTWKFVDEGNSFYRLRVVTTYLTDRFNTRVDTMEAGITCLVN
jgi:prepilin-type N-terminal cleavage/methylation domain-containing protein